MGMIFLKGKLATSEKNLNGAFILQLSYCTLVFILKKEKMQINVDIKDVHHGAITENLQIVQMLKNRNI